MIRRVLDDPARLDVLVVGALVVVFVFGVVVPAFRRTPDDEPSAVQRRARRPPG